MHFPTTPGIHDIETRQDDGRPARYTVSVPASIQAGHSPLVLVLHYAGTPTRFYGRPLVEQLFEPAWRALAPCVVAPESLAGAWNSAVNEAWVMRLLAAAGSAYGIDAARTVIGGYSMGAIGTWHFIEHYPEKFAAAVPIAGFPSQPLAAPVPVHALHSASDELFPLERLEREMTALAHGGAPAQLTVARVNGHYDVNGYRDALGGVAAWLARLWQLPE